VQKAVPPVVPKKAATGHPTNFVQAKVEPDGVMTAVKNC
jgi:hypothetical protein